MHRNLLIYFAKILPITHDISSKVPGILSLLQKALISPTEVPYRDIDRDVALLFSPVLRYIAVASLQGMPFSTGL